jgi:hypothetical protein
MCFGQTLQHEELNLAYHLGVTATPKSQNQNICLVLRFSTVSPTLCTRQGNAYYFARYAVLMAKPIHSNLYLLLSSVNTFNNHIG